MLVANEMTRGDERIVVTTDGYSAWENGQPIDPASVDGRIEELIAAGFSRTAKRQYTERSGNSMRVYWM